MLGSCSVLEGMKNEFGSDNSYRFFIISIHGGGGNPTETVQSHRSHTITDNKLGYCLFHILYLFS